MKAKLFIAALLISAMSFGQAINMASGNPRGNAPQGWSNGQSWYNFYTYFDDINNLNNSVQPKVAVVVSDSVLTRVNLTVAQSGATVLMKALAGDTIGLPAATLANVGVQYKILLVYSATSVGHCIYTAGTDVLYGTAFVSSITTPYTNPYLSTANKTMLMSTTTTGGLAGGEIDVVCVSPGRWSVHALLYGSSTPATPFKN